MQQILQGLSFRMLFLLIILGAIIYISFQIYKRLILPILLTKDNGPTQQRNTDRLEILIWVIYFLIVIYYSLLSSLLVTTIIIALIVFAFLDFWKNYFAGIVLRFGDKIQVGDTITVNDYSGKIQEFGTRALKMTNHLGEEILIPYQRINAEIKIGQKRIPKILFKTFTLENAVEQNAGAKQRLEKAIYNNPWIIVSQPVNIALEDKNAALSFYVLNNDFFEKAKARLVKDLGGV